MPPHRRLYVVYSHGAADWLGALFIDGNKGSVGGDDTRLDAQINDALLLLLCRDECFCSKMVDDRLAWCWGGAGVELSSVKGILCSIFAPSIFPFKVAVQSVFSRAFCDLSVAYTTNFSPLKTGGGFCGLCIT